jgi:hypothetical protein
MKGLTHEQFRVLTESDGEECAAAAVMREGRDLSLYVWDQLPVDEGPHVDDLIARGLLIRYECRACTIVDPAPNGDPITHTARTAKGDAAHLLYSSNPELVRGD